MHIQRFLCKCRCIPCKKPKKQKKPISPSGNCLDYIDGCFPQLKYFECFDSNKVLDIIDKLKPSDAGHDEVRTSLVKEVKFSIVDPLSFILSVSLDNRLSHVILRSEKSFLFLNLMIQSRSPIIVQFQYHHAFQKFLKK